MNSLLCSSFKLLKQQTCALTLLSRNYAKPGAPAAAAGKKKKGGKLGPVMEKVKLPVETDPVKLVNYVCGSNILKNSEPIKLKPDSEYPEWLWSINISGVVPVEDLDPNTKQYWRRVRRMNLRRNLRLSKNKKF